MNNTLNNGLRLLETLAGQGRPATLASLAQELDLPRSHVHRLLQSWKAVGYVQQVEGKRYAIDLGPLVLSNSLLASHPIRLAALPILQEASNRTGDDWILCASHGDRIITLAGAYVGRPLHAGVIPGHRMDPTRTATGRCRLAFDPTFEELHPRALDLQELEEIRDRGFAKKIPGDILGFAAPLGEGVPAYFIGTSGSRESMEARGERSIVADLLQQRHRLNHVIQGDVP